MKKKRIIVIAVLIFAIAAGILFRICGARHFLSIAAIMKDEKPYLKEWIEYHRLQGVEHFYLCDNGSTDGTKEYLQPYVRTGLITYIDFPGTNRQLPCYEYITKNYGKETKWLAFLDLDEFLVPMQNNDMQEFLAGFGDVDEVSLHWMNYGSNGIFSRASGLVTEAFTAHARFLNHTVKSIVRPEAVKDFSSFGANHYIPVKGLSVNEYHKPVSYMLNFNISGDKARVNHYITKSFAEFVNKKRRGHPEGTPINYGYYFFHNENDIKNDASMQRFLPELRRRMRQSPLPDVDIPKQEGLPETFSEFYFTPEEATQILGRPVTSPMSYGEVEKDYRKNTPPSYLPKSDK